MAYYSISGQAYILGTNECIDGKESFFITSENSVVLESGSNINFIAGKAIHFFPGFKANERCYMHA